MISQEKWMILTPLQKLPNNVEDLGKLIVAKGLKKLPKVKKIAQSGHTDWDPFFNSLINVLALHLIDLCRHTTNVWLCQSLETLLFVSIPRRDQ